MKVDKKLQEKTSTFLLKMFNVLLVRKISGSKWYLVKQQIRIHDFQGKHFSVSSFLKQIWHTRHYFQMILRFWFTCTNLEDEKIQVMVFLGHSFLD